jgi:predicted acetyltransferase
MSDGEFCGSISLRWQHGTSVLPEQVLGHIGFGVVRWKRGAGYAKQALALMLPEAWQRGLAYVELTTDPTNIASQKIITACGGRLLEHFMKPSAHGGMEGLRFRIEQTIDEGRVG